MKLLTTLGILLIIVAIFGGAMFGLNLYTGPIIEANNSGAASAELLEVLPNGSLFEEMNISELGLPEAIIKVSKETSGKGFVFEVKSAGYNPDMIVRIGVDAEGKITGSKCIQTNDTFGKEPEIDNKYNGQTLDTFASILIGGATMTSNGYSDAINFALQAYVLVSGGELDDDVILEGLIPTVAPAIVNPVALENITGNITKAIKSANDAGFAYIVKSGDASFLAIVNAMGVCKVYDVEGNDVTAANEAVANEAKAHAAANQTDYIEALKTKAGKMMEGAENIEAVALDTFNTVVAAVSFNVGDAKYYAFYSRSVGFHQMDVYFVIDETGAIAKFDAKQFIFEEEYFFGFGGMDVPAYKEGFVGATNGTWNEDVAVIATATMTSNAIKQSTKDAFDAFNSIKGGEQ